MDRRILLMIIGFNLIAICIAVNNKLFGTNKSTKVIYTIAPVPATGVFQTGDTINFTNKTDGATRCRWSFGDNETNDQNTATHMYADAGQYRVKLTVYGSFGSAIDTTRTISVVAKATPPPPEKEASIISGTETAELGKPYNFGCTLKADSYEWSLQDDPSGRVQTGSLCTYSFHSIGKQIIVLKLHGPDKTSHKEVNVVAAVAKAPEPQVSTHHKQTVHAPHASKDNIAFPENDGPSEVKHN